MERKRLEGDGTIARGSSANGWLVLAAAIGVVVVRLGTGSSGGTASAPIDTQPIAIPFDRVDCAGDLAAAPYRVGERTVVPIGKACPDAAVWLRWDDGHGAGAEHDAEDPVAWVLEPDTPDLELPSWQRVLPGRPDLRLRELDAALNTWDDQLIQLSVFGASRDMGDVREVELGAVVAFRLERAYLARADTTCGGAGDETCLVGAFEAVPPPRPSVSPGPTSPPTARPSKKPRPTPRPSGTGGPTPTASGSRAPSPSGPSTSPSIGPSSVPSATPIPPDAFLEISVPETVAIPLARNETNGIDVPIAVRGNVSWTLSVTDTGRPSTRGHMTLIGDPRAVLKAPMTAVVDPGDPASLERPAPLQLADGTGTSSIVVGLRQSVGPGDPPGTYLIRVMFSVIASF